MNNKCFLALAVLACTSLLAQTAAAKGFNYTYGEFGYQNTDAVTGDGDGFRVAFSFGATDYINVLGEYNSLFNIDNIDELSGIKYSSNPNIDRDEFKIGIGGHYPLKDTLDLTLSAMYVDQEFNGHWVIPAYAPLKTNLNDSEEGYEVRFGARVQLFKKFEMTPHLVHREIGSDSNSGGGLGFVYNFYKKFSLRVRATAYSDNNEKDLFAGVRLDM